MKINQVCTVDWIIHEIATLVIVLVRLSQCFVILTFFSSDFFD